MNNLEQAYFSPGDKCLDCITKMLRSSRKSIDICVFTITDNRIARAIKSAYQRDVAIRIITDNDKVNDRGSDIYELSGLGIPVVIDETSDHMHHKFAIFDEKVLLTGSYNWTRSAATQNENIVILNNAKLIDAFQTEFDRLWNTLAKLE